MDSGSFAGHRFIFFEADVVAAFTTDAACTHCNERCQGQSKGLPGGMLKRFASESRVYAVRVPHSYIIRAENPPEQDDGHAILHCSAGSRQSGLYNGPSL